MATDLFDPTKIDAAVGEAFGTRMPARQPAPAPAASTRRAAVVTDELLDRLRTVESGKDPLAVNKQTKAMGPYQFLPDTVQMLHRQGIKFNPFDERESREAARAYLGQLVERHGGNIELALKDYGGFVTKDPTKYVQAVTGTDGRAAPAPATAAAPAAAAAPATPGALTVEDLMKPQAVDAAVAEAFNEPPKQGKVANQVTRFLRSGAALADTLYSPVPAIAGMVTYAGARTFQGPEAAAATQARVTGALERPFGKAAGVTETPEYKGEVTQRVMEFIGENVSKGADWISQKTGMPKSDVEYYMNLGLTAAPFSKTVRSEVGMATQAAKQAGGKVVGAVADVTPAPVRRAVTGTVEAIAPGTTRAPVRAPTLGEPGAAAVVPPPPQVTMGRGSVGAAGVPDATIIRQALQTATPEFQQLYGNMPLDKVNTPVVLRHLEADSLPVPVRLTEGQATGDVVKLSNEQNLRAKQPAFAQRFNEQNSQLVENVPLIRERAAPDVYATKTIESSQALIDAYRALDDARNVDIRAAYKKLEDANGGQFPVDAQAIVQNADALLAKKMKTNFVPPEIAADLRAFREGAPMTFEQFEALRTNLAAEIRKAERSGDGNRAAAASLIRQAMEALPLKGEAASLKPLADQARTLAKARFDALKKDPAYKAAVEETVPADKYFDKFVVNGVNKNINTMVETLGRDSPAHQHMRAGTINWLSDKAGIVEGRGNFSQAQYNKALKKLDDVKNFQAIFDPESQLQLRTLGNVAAYTQFQPRGSFVNNSNTLVGYLANKAAGGLEQAGNVMGLKTFGYPIGSEARRVIRSARERREVERALQPGAGSTLQDISRQGQTRRGEPTLSNEPLPPGGGRREPTLD